MLFLLIFYTCKASTRRVNNIIIFYRILNGFIGSKAYCLFYQFYHISKWFQAVEFRIRKLEELVEQTLSTLGVIHRFMATHNRIRGNRTEIVGLDNDSIIPDRLRKMSERSDITDTSELSVPPPPVRRRPMVRSMTEVRPDPHLDSLYFPTRSHSINEPESSPLPEEDENKQSEVMYRDKFWIQHLTLLGFSLVYNLLGTYVLLISFTNLLFLLNYAVLIN